MMSNQESTAKAPAGRQISFAAKQRTLLLLGGIGVFVLLCLFVPNFSTAYNLFNVITQAAIYGTMSMGLAFVLITGGIDISLPYVMTMGSVVGVTYIARTGNSVVGCLCLVSGIPVCAGCKDCLASNLAPYTGAAGVGRETDFHAHREKTIIYYRRHERRNAANAAAVSPGGALRQPCQTIFATPIDRNVNLFYNKL